ncbi:MAG: tyrosine--tRNA ligase [Eubacteriales bacterium]|nr:tyrosine--tRNA ligase [Eubacteriales bacterium]
MVDQQATIENREFENVYDLLEARGFLAQANYPEEIREYLAKPGAVFYIGFDPTADSLHIGHFIQIIISMWLQKYGHKAIFVAGGGTGMIGDPSGRSDLRKVLTLAEIEKNLEAFAEQFSRFFDLDPERFLLLNNADWLKELKYLDYLREVGQHFSVNRMLSAECYKSRLEQGLTFLEFNYLTMQAYDYLTLFREHNCRLQLGGDDQWSNILAGSELIRRLEGEQVYVQTFALLTTSDGKKMGKTADGAIWLDAEKTSAFELYQYLRNVEDASVINYLKFLTLLPLSEIAKYEKLSGQDLNQAKIRLALETTSLIHGREAAEAARKQAESLFHGSGKAENMDAHSLSAEDLDLTLLDLLAEIDFIPSKSEGRRLMKQGGLYVNDQQVKDFNLKISELAFDAAGEVIIRRGKKHHLKLVKA